MRGSSSKSLPLPFASTVENVFGDGVIRQFWCHGSLTQQQARDFAHPMERDLVVLTVYDGAANQIEGAELESWRVFGIVTSMKLSQSGCKGKLRGPKDGKMGEEGIGSSVADSGPTLSLIIKVRMRGGVAGALCVGCLPACVRMCVRVCMCLHTSVMCKCKYVYGSAIRTVCMSSHMTFT